MKLKPGSRLGRFIGAAYPGGWKNRRANPVLNDTTAVPTATVTMPACHKNKTLASLLAFLLGAVGAHRFYLRGARDVWGWAHLAALPAALLLAVLAPQTNRFYLLLPLLLSALAGCLEALLLGLTSDPQWDAAHNAGSGRHSDSAWPLALLLVTATMIGAGGLIAAIARLSDLLYTGGAYG